MKHVISHIYLIFMYWMKHVISYIHLIFMYWMKHVTSQLSEHNCAVWYHSQSDIICSLILFTLIHFIFLILSQFYLTTVLLLFHFILSCASCILLSLRTATFFKKEAFVMNTASSWLLVSLDYSLCAGQIYISVYSFIALRKFIFFTLLFWALMSL